MELLAQNILNGVTIVPVIIAAMLIVALAGVLLERSAYRPLRHAGRLPPIISALGAAFVLESLARNIYGATYITYPDAISLTGGIRLIGDVRIGAMQILALVVSFAMMAGLWAFVNFTRTGTAMGGIGNIPGAMLGGMILGIVESLGAGYISPQWKDVIAYAMLALTLIVRPTGLLGERVAEKL